MHLKRRLTDLEEALDSLYETFGEAQKRLGYVNDIFEKNSIKQRIDKELLPDIHKIERQYWELLAQEADSYKVNEVEANSAIIQVKPEVVQLIENQLSVNYPDEFMHLLLEIRDKLNEPGQPAAAKAKLALNLVPGIFSYEIEIDTENSLIKAFQPIRELFKKSLNEGK